MAKFSNAKTTAKTAVRTPLVSTGSVPTFEGGKGFSRDAKSDLFMLAINNMVGEDTFYEKAADRDLRFRDLIAQVTKEDPEWLQQFIPFLRTNMFMRSATTVAAAEYARNGGPNARAVIASALQRPDEPAEILAYWQSRGYTKSGETGRGWLAVKKGAGDAAKRMYSEKMALKYDGLSRGFRMADVLNLTHPKPDNEYQSALFKYLIDRRFDRESTLDSLPVIAAWSNLQTIAPEKRRAMLAKTTTAKKFAEAGMTWESLSGWLGGPMDAQAWEAIIPSMGYMALLRNLRNFDEAGISKEMVGYVSTFLTDPEKVANSKQFPFRFWSAWKNLGSSHWAPALETALDLSTQNIPELKGSTLILTDTSGSMGGPLSGKSTIKINEAAALFAVALAKKCENVRLVQYASSWAERPIKKSDSTLRKMEQLVRLQGEVGHGTETWRAVGATYQNENRVIIFTDEQAFAGGRSSAVAKVNGPIYAFNFGGYGRTMVKNKDNQYECGGGLSDATFTMLNLLDTIGHTGWPWAK